LPEDIGGNVVTSLLISTYQVSTDPTMSFSADNALLVTGGTNPIMIWDIAKGQRISSLLLNKATENTKRLWFSLSLSPDGKTLATVNNNQIVKLWDIGTGTQLAMLEPRKKSETVTGFDTLNYSPDGKYLALSRGWIANVWDLTTLTEKQPIVGMTTHYLFSSFFSGDGKKFATILDHGVSIADFPAIDSSRKRIGGSDEAGISSDAQIIAAGTSDGKLRVSARNDDKELMIFGEPNDRKERYASPKFSADSSMLAAFRVNQDSYVSAYRDLPLDIWSLRDRKKLFTLPIKVFG
jgi:WD40 repeat protein